MASLVQTNGLGECVVPENREGLPLCLRVWRGCPAVQAGSSPLLLDR